MKRFEFRASMIVLVLVVAGLAGCSGSGGLTVRAKFTDVGDLATRAPVMMADVQVGRITGIRLSGNDALVTMSPQEAEAYLRQATDRIAKEQHEHRQLLKPAASSKALDW